MAKKIDKDLFDRLVNRQIAVGRYAERQAYEIIKLLNRADKELLAKIIDRGESDSFTGRRLEALLKETRSMVDKSYRELFDATKTEMVQFAPHAGEFAAATLSMSLPAAWSPVAISDEQLVAIVDKTPISIGKDKKLLLEEVFSSMAANKEEAIRGALRLGMVLGEDVPTMVRRLKGTKAAQYQDGLLEGSRKSMAAIVRTTTAHVNNVATQAIYAKNKDVLKGWLYVATLDSRVCSLCFSQSSKAFPIGEGPKPPRHVNCLPGDSLVTPVGRVLAVSKRWFDGDLVTIKTASGKTLSGTPNHPILTRGGWIAIGTLDVGCNVICHNGVEFASVDIDRDNKNVPARIEDIAEAFLNRSEVLSEPVKTTAVDFHGDGSGSEVAIIGADRELWIRNDAALGEHIHELKFVSGDNSTPGACTFNPLGEGASGSPHGIIGRFGKLLSLLWGSVFHAGQLLFTSIPGVYPRFFKNLFKVGAGYGSHSFADTFEPNSGLEQLDSLFQINNRGIVVGLDTVAVKDAVDGSFSYSITCGNLPSCLSGLVLAYNNLIRGDVGTFAKRRPRQFQHCIDAGIRAIKLFSNFVWMRTRSVKLCHLFGVSSKPKRALLGPCPDTDPSLLEPVNDDGSAYSELARKITSGRSGEVFIDEIVDIKITNFSGHVYNLQTELNWYISEGIVTHNCRCFQAPNIKTWEEIGFDLPEFGKFDRAAKGGPVDADISFHDWLKDQDSKTQVELLGPARARLFADGKVHLDKFTDASGVLYTLAELKARM